jgi:hypothetical protein
MNSSFGRSPAEDDTTGTSRRRHRGTAQATPRARRLSELRAGDGTRPASAGALPRQAVIWSKSQTLYGADPQSPAPSIGDGRISASRSECVAASPGLAMSSQEPPRATRRRWRSAARCWLSMLGVFDLVSTGTTPGSSLTFRRISGQLPSRDLWECPVSERSWARPERSSAEPDLEGVVRVFELGRGCCEHRDECHRGGSTLVVGRVCRAQ